jgi:heme-degrading monooxygenase HmoA
MVGIGPGSGLAPGALYVAQCRGMTQNSSATPFASTPEPPYYAVIFSNQRTPGDDGYAAMAEQMMALALAQPGCLGAESTRSESGFGITVSYWRDEQSIAAWRENVEHLVAQRLGRERWYTHYALRVARVERAYSGPASR